MSSAQPWYRPMNSPARLEQHITTSLASLATVTRRKSLFPLCSQEYSCRFSRHNCSMPQINMNTDSEFHDLVPTIPWSSRAEENRIRRSLCWKNASVTASTCPRKWCYTVYLLLHCTHKIQPLGVSFMPAFTTLHSGNTVVAMNEFNSVSDC